MSTILASQGDPAASRDVPDSPPNNAIDPSQEVPSWVRALLGLFLMALGLVLLYLIIALWPAVQATATGSDEQATITWFGWSYSPTADVALIILVILVSALGSFVHAAVSFSDYVGNRQFARSWIWWYLLRVFVGASLAVLFYFAIRGGFFSSDTSSTVVNPYGVAALAGLVGLFSKQATDKLREVFDTAFRVERGTGDDARADGLVNPTPVLERSEPQSLTRGGELGIILVGSGFVQGANVTVARSGGSALSRKAKMQSGQRLQVSLEAEDLAAPGTLLFKVANPEPGGGVSEPLAVAVEDDNGSTGGGPLIPDPSVPATDS